MSDTVTPEAGSEPWKPAPPNVNTPPSAAASTYPLGAPKRWATVGAIEAASDCWPVGVGWNGACEANCPGPLVRTESP